MIENNSKVPPSFLISVRFLCVILIFFGYCFNFMQKIDMSIAIVCMTNHTAIKMLQQTNKTSSFLMSNYTNNNSSLFNLTGQENLSTINNNKPLDLNNNHMASNNNKNVKIASCLDKWYKELKGHVLVIFFFLRLFSILIFK